MRLYLRADLLKSEGAPKLKAKAGKPVDPNTAKTGETRGGTYVARVQNGYDKDGSPQYRYFRTEEDYETYLRNKGKSASAKKLEEKVKKEHETSKEKTTGHIESSEDNTKASDKKDDDDDKDKKRSSVSKGLRLFIEV